MKSLDDYHGGSDLEKLARVRLIRYFGKFMRIARFSRSAKQREGVALPTFLGFSEFLQKREEHVDREEHVEGPRRYSTVFNR